MKKVLIAALLASALPALAEPASCGEYHQKMEETLKKEGNYSEEAMKLVKDQTAAIPAEQQDAFCKAGIDGLSAQAGNHS
ncbi:MAG: cell surface protein [Cardiobacteriaceae bacterium]|nr:cell surface protein [Cardiobacteriaceae bacterium]